MSSSQARQGTGDGDHHDVVEEEIPTSDAASRLWEIARYTPRELLQWLQELATQDKVIRKLLQNHLEMPLSELAERKDHASQEPIAGLPYRTKNPYTAVPTSAGAVESRGVAGAISGLRKRVRATRAGERKRARTGKASQGHSRDIDTGSEGDEAGVVSAEEGRVDDTATAGNAGQRDSDGLITSEVPVLDGSTTVVTNYYSALCAAIARGIAVERLGDVWLRQAVIAHLVVKCSPPPHEYDVPYLIGSCVAWDSKCDAPAKRIRRDVIAASVSTTPTSSDMEISESSDEEVRNCTPGSGSSQQPGSSDATSGSNSERSDPGIPAEHEDSEGEVASAQLPGDPAGATLMPSNTNYSPAIVRWWKSSALRIARSRLDTTYGKKWIDRFEALRNVVFRSQDWPTYMGDDPYPEGHQHRTTTGCGNCCEEPELEGLGTMYSKTIQIFGPKTRVYFFACKAIACAKLMSTSEWLTLGPKHPMSKQATEKLIREIQTTSVPMCLLCRLGLGRIRQRHSLASSKHRFYEWIVYKEGGPGWVEQPPLDVRYCTKLAGVY